MPGSVRIQPEQISAVTDLVPEQRRPDRTITICILLVYEYIDCSILKYGTSVIYSCNSRVRRKVTRKIKGENRKNTAKKSKSNGRLHKCRSITLQSKLFTCFHLHTE